MRKTIIFLFIFMIVTSSAYAGRKKFCNSKKGTVKVKFIGNNSFDINSQVIHSAKPVEKIKTDQSVEIIPGLQKVKTCNVNFNIQSEGPYIIKEVFETNEGTSEERKIHISKNKKKVSLNFVDPKKKDIKKVTYTIYSL